MNIFIHIFVLTLLFGFTLPHKFSYCYDYQTFVTEMLTIQPNPVIIGKDVTVTMVGHMTNNVFPSILETIIQYGSVSHVIVDKYCDVDKTQCRQYGGITLEKTMTLYNFIESGVYDAKIVLYDNGYNIAGCIITSVSVKIDN